MMTNQMKDLNIALVMFDGAEEQDVVGPWEMFWWATTFDSHPEAKDMTEADFGYTFNTSGNTSRRLPNIFTVAPTTDPITMSSGMRFLADYSFGNVPSANVVVVPGGEGARATEALKANGTLDYIHKLGTQKDCKYVMSVCTGSFVLGHAGLLDGVHCTTYMNQYNRFAHELPAAKLVRNTEINFVQDGKHLTSNGPCSGLATSLRLVEDHVGTRKKDKLRELLSFVYPTAKGLILENGSLTEHNV
jgi:transcriptional regulator GlxA family with amidase domain